MDNDQWELARARGRVLEQIENYVYGILGYALPGKGMRILMCYGNHGLTALSIEAERFLSSRIVVVISETDELETSEIVAHARADGVDATYFVMKQLALQLSDSDYYL